MSDPRIALRTLAAILGGWRTVEVRRGFYRQRWPEGQETPHA